MPRLTLVGFRGTGKSTVAEAVASRIGCGWHDADDEFERRFGGSVAGFFAAHGEQAFRDREEELLERLLDGCPGVLSTGGGYSTVVARSSGSMLRPKRCGRGWQRTRRRRRGVRP